MKGGQNIMIKNAKKKQYVLSIIIPIYNAEKFIETAIQSIVRQLQPWIEVILINDGSLDSSEQICMKYLSDQIVYYHINNSGAGHARNVGINYSRGEWIIFLDSDDLILGGFFNNNLFLYLKKCKEKLIDIIYTPKIECNMKLTEDFRIEYPENKNEIEYFLPKLEFWTCIYNSNFLKKKNIRFFEYKKQDIETAFRFRAFSNTQNILIDKRRIFYIHRNNPTSNINTLNFYNYFEIKGLVYYDLFSEFNDHESNTSVWLYTQYLYYMKQMLVRCLQLGGTDENLNQLKNLILKIKNKSKKIPIKKLSFKYKLFYYFVHLLCVTSFFHVYSFYVKKRKRIDLKKRNIGKQNKDDIEKIFMNMEKYERKINIY